MGKLSKLWHRARINITPSTLQVQHKIDESAAHYCLIDFTVLSITLCIITHFCASVHLFTLTHTTETDHCTVHLWQEYEEHSHPPDTTASLLSVCWQMGPPHSVFLVDKCNPAAEEIETWTKTSRLAFFSSQLSPSWFNRVLKNLFNGVLLWSNWRVSCCCWFLGYRCFSLTSWWVVKMRTV